MKVAVLFTLLVLSCLKQSSVRGARLERTLSFDDAQSLVNKSISGMTPATNATGERWFTEFANRACTIYDGYCYVAKKCKMSCQRSSKTCNLCKRGKDLLVYDCEGGWNDLANLGCNIVSWTSVSGVVKNLINWLFFKRSLVIHEYPFDREVPGN